MRRNAQTLPVEIHGWGRHPRCLARQATPLSLSECVSAVDETDSLIARGLGRSYGDSSLGKCVLNMRGFDNLQAFDEQTGLLRCEAGVSIAEIARVFVPKGWFVPVTPGTSCVTVGGAIASDVHGKNHHVDGSFSDHVTEIQLLLGNGEQVAATPSDHGELFKATCGGMGLTGIILAATIRLRPIKSSLIDVTAVRTSNLEATLEAFAHHDATYSVAWIDCMAKGKNLGRAVLQLGEHATSGGFACSENQPKLSVVTDMPSFVLNRHTARAFNALYYHNPVRKTTRGTVSYPAFFYPLDGLGNWNRLYGKNGFCQYQLVLPLAVSNDGLRTVLEHITGFGCPTFLAVLKLFGKGNDNYLSFPIEGYTLTLDLKNRPDEMQLMNELDDIVADLGGRMYLTKDARMSEAVFKAGYPRWQQFEEVRATWHATGKFASIQSQRLGLE